MGSAPSQSGKDPLRIPGDLGHPSMPSAPRSAPRCSHPAAISGCTHYVAVLDRAFLRRRITGVVLPTTQEPFGPQFCLNLGFFPLFFPRAKVSEGLARNWTQLY